MLRILGLFAILAVAYILYVNYGYRYVLNDVRDNADRQMIMGNSAATTNIVAYIDYASPSSRQLHPVLLNLMASDQDISAIIRPVSSDSTISELAIRLALAAKRENRFLDVHNILMGSTANFNQTYIERAIRSLDMDYNALLKIALTQEVEDEMRAYNREAAFLKIDMFPYFYIEHIKMPGATYTVEEIRKIVKDLRTGRL